MLTHIKSGYGFLNVYMRYTNTFLIHIRFCSLCILLRRKVLACSTYLLASMTDHPGRDLLLCTCAVHLIIILTGCAYRPPEAVLALIGSRILTAVYICILATQWNEIYRLIIKQRKPNVIEQYTPVISMYISDSHPVFGM